VRPADQGTQPERVPESIINCGTQDTNHLDFLQLTRILHTPGPLSPDRTFEQARCERLAAAAGQSLAPITRLHWPEPGTYSTDPAGFRRSLRPACRHCMGRRSLLDSVPCKIPAYITVCRRHQLWIGPGVRTLADQYDLRPLLAVRAIALPPALFADVAPKVILQWRGQAAVESTSHLRAHPNPAKTVRRSRRATCLAGCSVACGCLPIRRAAGAAPAQSVSTRRRHRARRAPCAA